MFRKAIKGRIHPATWAVIGVKHTAVGDQVGHRGTAFALDAQGHLLTCWHVTYMDDKQQIECDELWVVQPDFNPAARYLATVVKKEKNRDIAILKILDGSVVTSPIPIARSAATTGTSCAAFGHPLSVTDPATASIRIFSRATAGIVSMPVEMPGFDNGSMIHCYELDYFTHGGSSGGPVFLRSGDTFGWIRGSLMLDDGAGQKKRSNLSVAIDIREAIEFLKPLNINLKIRGRFW